MINDYISKARVILTSIVTIATALAFAATQVAEAAEVPVVGEVAGQAAIFLAAAITVLRRVTPVATPDIGILP